MRIIRLSEPQEKLADQLREYSLGDILMAALKISEEETFRAIKESEDNWVEEAKFMEDGTKTIDERRERRRKGKNLDDAANYMRAAHTALLQNILGDRYGEE